MLKYECEAWSAGHERVAGVDEAGRGPLAGPVVAAAVIFDKDFLLAEENGQLNGLTDSKKLTEARRESFFELLTACPQAVIGIGIGDVREIESINILQATVLAMKRALDACVPPADHILLDGSPVRDFASKSTPIVGGDGQSLSIAAASVIAKVTRDRMMKELDAAYPAYGFASHKGYGTKRHLAALREHGPTPVHRKTFDGVCQMELF